MWFGTRDCLNKYNGQSIKVYKSSNKDPTSISSNDYIYSLLEDKQKNLWIGTQFGLNRYLPETDAFERIINDPDDPSSISGNSVTCLFQDSKGGLWFGTTDGLNLLKNASSRKFVRFGLAAGNKPGLVGAEIYAIYEDRLKNIWIGTNAGLTKMALRNGKWTFSSFTHSETDNSSLSANFVTSITEDLSGNLWVGTETGGLNLYNPLTNSFIHFQHSLFDKNSLSNNNIRKILVDKTGKLWIGTLDGLNIFDPSTRQFSVYRNDSENNKSLNNNSIKEIYQDSNGTIWIGTMYGGVNVFHPNALPFTLYQNSKFNNSISSNIICAIATDSKENVWVGTEGAGLNCLDRATNKFRHFVNDPNNATSISSNFVKDIYRDKEGNLWVGLYQGGLELYQPSSGTFKHYKHNPANPGSINSNNVSYIYEDSRNRFWVGTSASGLNLFDRKKQQFRAFTADPASALHLSSNRIRVVLEDSKRNLWIGTARGLNLLPENAKDFKHLLKDDKNPKSLRSNYINCVHEDKSGRIWIGSYHGGLSLYNPKDGSFTTFTEEQGLVSDNVIGILEDDQGFFWISTDKGLSKFNSKTFKFRNFDVKDGLPSNEYNQNSAFEDAAGEMFFGSYNGLIRFKPGALKDNSFAPEVVFTGLKLFNKPVEINGPDGLLRKDISVTNTITFSYDQNIFSLDFAALNYLRPEKNQYAYRLYGFEKDWNYVSNPTATYTNLPPGEYTFLVRGSNNDGKWSKLPARMFIRILPPFWKTWWAYLFYFVSCVAISYWILKFTRKQARLESDLYHEHLHNERQQELYQMKLDFFTKISHEIRTPLTLILAPLEKLVDITANNPAVNKQLIHVKNNADRLLRLISELLDFRKVETGYIKLQVSRQDISAFCYDIYNSFHSLAVSKKISLEFEGPPEPLPAYFDKNQMEKVLYNIVSNAFKFTAEGGRIEIQVRTTTAYLNSEKKKCAEIVVTDNGIGISLENQAEIFENFFQVSNPGTQATGWGIGLALAKNIIEQHKGSISVKSIKAEPDIEGKTSFIIHLPLDKNHFTKDQLLPESALEDSALQLPEEVESIENDDPTEAEVCQRNTILIVEDNDEVRGFIKESLSNDYNIVESVNGKEGLAAAVKHIPDLIISDVMMPEMDGLEMCSKLKADERTNHIPVILLTARAAHIHHVEGLEVGADAYVAKPFSVKILELNVRNLLSLREAIKHKFSHQVSLQPREKIIGSPDAKFLNKMMEIIENQMEDPEFGVAALVKEIGMSQTVLYRKVKALTDLSITDFIKTIRLKQAAQLLKQNKVSISEVAFAVGFNDRKYFSKEFRKHFGKAPTAYISEIVEGEAVQDGDEEE